MLLLLVVMAQAFEDRAAQVFDVLEKHNPNTTQPMWWLRESLAAEPGAGGESTDEEQQDQEQQERIDVRYAMCCY